MTHIANTDLWMMQYPITLPADYDMQIIRHRVATKGAALDGRNGLGFKAYAIRERGVDESPVNLYAPFYLWTSTASAADFLAGPAAMFRGIVDSFGRPRVNSWLPVGVASGPVPGAQVRTARLWTKAIPETDDLTDTAHRLAAATAGLAERPEVHVAVAGIDVSAWQTALFVTASTPPPDPGAPGTATSADHSGGTLATYQVLHVSEGPHTKPQDR